MGDRWVLLALTVPGRPADLAHWLHPYGPSEVTIAPGIAPKVLRATFHVLPETWQHAFSSVSIQFMELFPDGSATLFLEDTPDHVRRFVEELRRQDGDVRCREMRHAQEDLVLTDRQWKVLSLAVAAGYYDVPHRLTLRDLADKLGLSVGAVAEVLRRGEAVIITSYVDSVCEARWNDPPAVSNATQTG